MWKGEIPVTTEFKWLVEVYKDEIKLKKNPRHIIDEILPLDEFKIIDTAVDECGKIGQLIDEKQDTEIKIKDIAVDECGNIYLIDGISEQILLYNILNKVIDPLKCLNKELDSIKEFEIPETVDISHDTLCVRDNKIKVTFARVNGQLRNITAINDENENNPAEIHGLDGNLYKITKDNEVTRRKYKEDRYDITSSVYVSEQFDSYETSCKWHRLELDADIPPKTHVDVYYFISDKDTPNNNVPWMKLTTFQSEADIYDVLLPNIPGRFLHIKLDLISTDEFSTPTIRLIKAYFPRISYLRYLPAVYQENEISREFLERFMSLFETFMWKKEEQIDDISSYFDADSTPREFLDWLATWTSTVFDESWSESKKRTFLKNAVNLYKKRGTREGLEELIKIYTGNEPLIVENWQLYGKDTNCQSRLKCEKSQSLKELLGKQAPYHFCVIFIPYIFTIDTKGLDKLTEGQLSEKLKERLLKKGINISNDAEIHPMKDNEWIIKDKENLLAMEFENNIKIYNKPLIDIGSLQKTFMRLIEVEKPAHTTAGAVIIQPWTYLGMHTYLGVNSFLSKPPQMRLGTGSAINRDTVLGDNESSGQLNVRSRIEIDTKLT